MKFEAIFFLSLLCSIHGRLSEPRRDEEEIHVFIEPKNEKGLGLISKLASLVRPRFKRLNTVKAVVTRARLEELQNDPDILYVEEDGWAYEDGEAELYGLEMVQADSPLIPTANVASSAACNDPNSFKIGIIDSGLAVNHPDVPCLDITDQNTNCIGKEFGLEKNNGMWYNPIRKFHGTHVFGTIGASGLNNEGIRGVISDGNICFLIGRVFGENGDGSRMSDVYDAVEWMVDNGVKILNLSLGGTQHSETGQKIVNDAWDAGVLLVAAAGNDGTTDDHYPANFKNVISVAAVDENEYKAGFSQYNNGVDIAAPGVDILSTFPMNLGGAVFISSSSTGTPGGFMRHSSLPEDDLLGVLVYCPDLGKDECPGVDGKSGHICLIGRGEITFEEKTLNCEKGGGIAAIIYNNDSGSVSGGLSEETKTSIPAVEIRQTYGLQLKEEALGETVNIEILKGYGRLSGTSMAVPHVVGVAGKIWRACPACTNEQVQFCLFSTADDIGKEGKDASFGYGLIKAEEAYLCLVNTAQCCGTA